MTEYTDEDIKRMNISALSCNKSRLKELIDFAKLSGYHKLGIANCFFMQKYAKEVPQFLSRVKENLMIITG